MSQIVTTPTGPGSDLVPLDALKSNTVDLGKAVGAIRCKGNPGNIVVVTLSGSTRTYPITVEEGWVPCVVKRVLATGTTATGLWGWVP